MQRIPYQESALKSVPPLAYLKNLGVDVDAVAERTSNLKDMGEKAAISATNPTAFSIEVLFPKNVIPASSVLNIVRRLATGTTSLHRRKIWWNVAAMPVTLPLVIIPVYE